MVLQINYLSPWFGHTLTHTLLKVIKKNYQTSVFDVREIHHGVFLVFAICTWFVIGVGGVVGLVVIFFALIKRVPFFISTKAMTNIKIPNKNPIIVHMISVLFLC